LYPSINPATIPFCHPHDQGRDLVTSSAASGRSERAPIIIFGNQFSVPSQQCFRRNDRRDLRQHLATNLLRLSRQTPALIVIEHEASIANLFSKDPVFFHQVLDDVPLMLIHSAGCGLVCIKGN